MSKTQWITIRMNDGKGKIQALPLRIRSNTKIEPRNQKSSGLLQGAHGENYSIEVIDLKEHPQLAEGEQIIATPALIKKLPEPMRVLVGDLSDKNKFLVGMNLLPVR